MSDKPVIFISHSSKDEELANELKKQIEACFDHQVEAFVARFSIEPSKDWLHEIIENLKIAQALIVLMTPFSKASYWVGFEVGYLYERIISNDPLPVYPLRLPNTEVFGPFWHKQSTSLDNTNDVKAFFNKVSKQFDNYVDKADIESIVQSPEISQFFTMGQKTT